MKRILFLLTLAAFTAPNLAFAQWETAWKDANVNSINRLEMHTTFAPMEQQRVSLHGTWNFSFVHEKESAPADFYKVGYDDSKWGTIQVPGMWELSGYGDPLYLNTGYAWRGHFENNPPIPPTEENRVGSYRKEFRIPANWAGKQIIAHFGSVTSNIALYVNGKFAGYSEDSKLECEFDITKLVKVGQDNLIAFQVMRWCDGSYLEDQDFFRFTGVARDNYLYTRSQKHVEDVRLNGNLADNYKDGILDISVKLSHPGLTAAVVLSENDGKEIQKVTLKGQKEMKAQITVPNVKRWSAETPNLYQVLLTLSDNKGVIETIPLKTGFRRIEIKNSQLLVNGMPILIKGADRHELDPDGGYIVSRDRMIQDIQEMKKMNINAVRTCHYPDDAIWYDLCDEYGIYVLSESNVESHGMGYGKETLANNPLFAFSHVERNKRHLQRNYNHPSIIGWSLGNEAGYGENFEKAYHWMKNEDPSRPVQYERAELEGLSDIYCPMYLDYKGMEKYAQGNDSRPLIQCEYAHAMGNSMGGFKEYWDLIRKYPKLQGGFIWDFVDQSVYGTKNGKQIWVYGGDYNTYDPTDGNFCDNGLIAPDRTWHPHAYEVQHYYQNIWVRDVDLKRGKIAIFNENFFTDLSNYYLVWTLLADGKAIQSGVKDNLQANPQQEMNLELPYDLSAVDKTAELYLNVYFYEKNPSKMIPAGYAVSKNQLLIREGHPTDIIIDTEMWKDLQCKETSGSLNVSGEDFCVTFDAGTGYLTAYKVRGKELLDKGASLTPNFWRSPTDNDYGAQTQKRFKVWKDVAPQLTSFEKKQLNGEIQVVASYILNKVGDSKLVMTYAINKSGQIKVNEQLTINGEQPNMYRYGMKVQLPKAFDTVEYWGRGPIENYWDRQGAAFVGRYEQHVNEMAHLYIRQQETGTRTDLREWKITDKSGNGLIITSDKLFSASALPYTVESLDEGEEKTNGHMELIDKSDFITLCVDLKQQGLGCIDSWYSTPLPQYMIPAENMEFNFVLTPMR